MNYKPVTKEDFLYGMSAVMTEKQYEKSKEYVEKLSDYDFEQLIAQIKTLNIGIKPNLTPKEYIDIQEKLWEMNGVNVENTALKNVPIKFMSEHSNNNLLKKINQSVPSDKIMLDRKSDVKIMSLWTDNKSSHVSEKGIKIPSDIFFAGTIPFMDCKIVIDETKEKGDIITYRVVIFDDYKEQIKRTKGNGVILAGALITEATPKYSYVSRICIVSGVNSIIGSEKMGYINMPPDLRDYVIKKVKSIDMVRQLTSCLETWYGIQTALLHPAAKEIFKNPWADIENGQKIKTHIINISDINKHL